MRELHESLHRIERSIAGQQADYATTREHILAGGPDLPGALEHAADLALNLQGLYRRDLDLRGRLATGDGEAGTSPATPEDLRDRLARVTASLARRIDERSVIERRIEELRARDDPAVFSAIGEAADVDQDLRRLQELEIELRRLVRGISMAAENAA